MKSCFALHKKIDNTPVLKRLCLTCSESTLLLLRRMTLATQIKFLTRSMFLFCAAGPRKLKLLFGSDGLTNHPSISFHIFLHRAPKPCVSHANLSWLLSRFPSMHKTPLFFLRPANTWHTEGREINTFSLRFSHTHRHTLAHQHTAYTELCHPSTTHHPLHTVTHTPLQACYACLFQMPIGCGGWNSVDLAGRQDTHSPVDIDTSAFPRGDPFSLGVKRTSSSSSSSAAVVMQL